MILVCPACGASASLEAWSNDREWRDLIMFLPRVDVRIQARAITYLGLFRTGKRALRPAKAFKILQGLLELTASGTVHWEHGETRPAPPELWAQALDAVIERRPAALTNHNYLKHTAWDMAAGLAAQAEQQPHPQMSQISADRAEGEAKARRRGCYCCESFRPPKGCAAKSHPASGNQMLGCGQWEEKAAAPVGDLFGGIVAGLSHEEQEGHEG